MKTIVACLVLASALPLPAAGSERAATAPWVADLGDGRYRNPVIHADYSDPDAVRVGDDYWMVSSSFSHVPAIPVLHSRDLVNWTLVNHAVSTLVPVDHFSSVRHGQGVWAPAIRFHKGRFHVYYPDPDFGIYVVTATDPRGKWSDPVLVKAGKGLIDPCPFWDDDGQVYLVHAYARSRGPVANRLSMTRLSPDGMKAVGESEDVIDANKMEGWRTLEGPKMYKRNGYYFIFAPAGGVKEGYQAVFRSKNIKGPYENRIVLEQGGAPVNGPHQGAWVDTPKGEHWFVHFQDKDAYGRIVHLQPMTWREDGWPAMGTAVASGGTKGEPVLTHRKPDLPGQPIAVPATSDTFDAPKLGLQWQWQANPKADWWSLSAKRGSLRLKPVSLPEGGLYDAPNLLMQKFPAPTFSATTVLDGAALGEGSEAGLIVFGYSHAWIGLRRDRDGLKLVHATNVEQSRSMKPLPSGKTGETVLPAKSERVHLRVRVNPGARCEFSYSHDGNTFEPVSTGEPFQATVARWVGAKVGVFAARPTTAAPAGDADFATFEAFEVSP